MSPTVARAQIAALKPRLPFLYGILIINTFTFAFIHTGTVSPWIVWGVPLCATLAMGLRTVYWARLDVDALDDCYILRLPRLLVFATGAIGLVLMSWAELVQWLAAGSLVPSVDNSGTLQFYIGVSSITCISLLMHVSAASLVLAVCILIPFSTVLLLFGGAAEVAMAVNLLLAGAAMSYVAVSFSREFRRMATSTDEMRKLSIVNARLAVSDPLTGLPNRRSFFGDLERVPQLQASFAILLLDLDGFKHVNDIYGHKAGDTVLLAIVERMQAILPDGATLARLGGDEFGCLLQGAGVHCADALATSLIAACRVPIECLHFTATVGASIGLCRGEPGDEAILCYERADYALFQAKRTGRGHAMWFTGAHEASMRRASHIAHLLLSLDLETELTTAYQPIVAAATRELTAFEALVRWNSPVLGWVSPGEFIPIAERSDVIFDITRLVVRKALADAAKWPADISIKINVSVRDLKSRVQTEALVDELLLSGFPPGRVAFEVTETIFAESLEEVCNNVNVLRSTGCRIAIDDFGVGYSSLNYIHMLSPDTIKIDRCFIGEVTTSDRTRRVVRTIIDLARHIGALTVAEGVETEEQARALHELGCDRLQGFHLSRPLFPSAALAFAQAHPDRAGHPPPSSPPGLQCALVSAT